MQKSDVQNMMLSLKRVLNWTEKAGKQADELTKQVVGTFYFGMLNGCVLNEKKSSVWLQGTTIAMFIKELGYDMKAAVQFYGELCRSMQYEPEETLAAIAHRGLEGYYQWKEGAEGQLKENVEEVLAVIREGA